MIHSWTRRIAASLLLFCLGLTVPAVAGPMHLCLTELLKSELAEEDCCNHGSTCCDSEEPVDSPCCLDLQELPDAPAPPSADPVPEAKVTDLGWNPSIPPLHAQSGMDLSLERPKRIRGPCSPSDHRALLEIWRL